ncbi:DNA mismatch repair protein MutS [soil metagenome]
MRPGLLHPHHDVDLTAPASHEGHGLIGDLELTTLVDAMSDGEASIADAAQRLLLDPLVDPAAIAFRQGVLTACLARPDVARELFEIAGRTLERRKKMYWGLVQRPDAVVHQGIELMHMYRGAFRDLRSVADAHVDDVEPGGFRDFLSMLRRELDDPFLAELDAHLRALRFQDGIRVSARLGRGNRPTGYVLERPAQRRPGPATRFLRWWRSLRGTHPSVYTYRLPAHDDSGVRALTELQARGLQRTADAVGAACNDLLAFFRQLRGELAFYVGCIGLHERLRGLGAPTCMPEPVSAPGVHGATGLYDASLALTIGARVVGNDLDADGADLLVVTGANGGGKTTFLRSVGNAQLMMQCGMFVPASAYRASLTSGLFTHFTRQEDTAMRSGKLDEELSRLNDLVHHMTSGATLLLNESFASTNEREGSELASGVVRALTESGVRVLFVTHLSQFARELYDARRTGTRFLRAERQSDGTRTFRMVTGAPERTSHGADLYAATFGSVGSEAEPVARTEELR